LTGDVTGNCSGQAGTVATITGLAPDTATTQAAQPNITSLGTLTSLIIANTGTIGSASDTAIMTFAADGTTTFSVFPVTPSAAPDADYEVSNKKYVDDNAGGSQTPIEQNVDYAGYTLTNVVNVGIGTSNAGQAGLAVMSGNVGIGTTNPSEKLEVAGNIAVTGTVDGKDVSTLGSGDMSYANTRFKVIGFSINTTTATGTQAVTGVGFTPKAIIFTAQQQTTREASFVGFDVSGGKGVVYDAAASAGTYDGYLDGGATRPSIYDEETSGAKFYSGNVQSYDADGFTVSWTKNSTPTGTLAVLAICFR